MSGSWPSSPARRLSRSRSCSPSSSESTTNREIKKTKREVDEREAQAILKNSTSTFLGSAIDHNSGSISEHLVGPALPTSYYYYCRVKDCPRSDNGKPNSGFLQEYELKQHQVMHGRYLCPFCLGPAKSFSLLYDLLEHVKAVHPEKSMDDLQLHAVYEQVMKYRGEFNKQLTPALLQFSSVMDQYFHHQELELQEQERNHRRSSITSRAPITGKRTRTTELTKQNLSVYLDQNSDSHKSGSILELRQERQANWVIECPNDRCLVVLLKKRKTASRHRKCFKCTKKIPEGQAYPNCHRCGTPMERQWIPEALSPESSGGSVCRSIGSSTSSYSQR